MRIALTILLSFSILSSSAQRISDALINKDFQQQIIDATSKYDSLIMVDISNNNTKDKKIGGLVFMDGTMSQIVMVFHGDTAAAEDLAIFRSKRVKIKEEKINNEIMNATMAKVKSWNEDSLSIKGLPGKSYPYTSNPDKWTIIAIDQRTKSAYVKQSANPELYQKNYPTNDRQAFINMVAAINELSIKK
ncbi:MAG: hypothetical protein HKN22_03845 [Bacteroidia bacterium]|nr:hypothetical protein [Bacteroidia bacterium]